MTSPHLDIQLGRTFTISPLPSSVFEYRKTDVEYLQDQQSIALISHPGGCC